MTIARISLRVKIRRGETRAAVFGIFFFSPLSAKKEKTPPRQKTPPRVHVSSRIRGMIIFIVSL